MKDFVYLKLFISFICFTGCQQDKLEPIYLFENYENIISESVITSSDSVFLGRPYSLSLIKDELVMYDFYDQKMVTWYSLQNKKTKHNINVGNGPGEFIPPLYIYAFGDDKIKLYERSSGTFYTYEWTDVYNDNLKVPLSTEKLDIVGVNAVPCGQDYLFNSMDENLNLFTLLLSDNKEICRFGKYPGSLNKSKDVKSLHLLTQCLISVESTGELMVAAGYMSDMLSFYKRVGNDFVLCKEYFSKDADLDIQYDNTGWHTKPNERTLNTYVSLSFSKDKLFALYLGTKDDEVVEKSFVQVFDLNGNFIKGYVVPEYLRAITVDESGKTLYGLSLEDDVHISVYNLNSTI